jgi:hypothetical protein
MTRRRLIGITAAADLGPLGSHGGGGGRLGCGCSRIDEVEGRVGTRLRLLMAVRDQFAHYSNGIRELRHTELARFARQRKRETLIERAPRGSGRQSKLSARASDRQAGPTCRRQALSGLRG